MATVTLRLTPQRAHVRTARLVAAAMARRSGVSEELLDEVRLAVGEACGRAVQLHERYGLTAPIVLTLVDDDGRFQVAVRDLAPSKPGDDPPVSLLGARADRRPRLDPVQPIDPGAPGLSAPGMTGPGVAAGGMTAASHIAPASSRPGAAGPADAGGTPANPAAGPDWQPRLDAGLGLALLDALVEDISIESGEGMAGTEVTMTWPIGRRGGSGPGLPPLTRLPR